MTNTELKSKAMTLGNRLAPRYGDRREAFIQAWAIVKAGTVELPVRGTSFGTRQEALRRLARYNPTDVRAILVPEPENPADPTAVAVMVGVQEGRGLYKLGYVPRTAAPLAGTKPRTPRRSPVKNDMPHESPTLEELIKDKPKEFKVYVRALYAGFNAGVDFCNKINGEMETLKERANTGAAQKQYWKEGVDDIISRIIGAPVTIP